MDEDAIKLAHYGAQKGSENDQVFLGAHYLKLADAGIKPEENGKKAVDWLIKASKQGNEEATKLLQECVNKEIGKSEICYIVYFDTL